MAKLAGQNLAEIKGNYFVAKLLDELELMFGVSQGSPTLKIPGCPITIFVGPNNSGKSMLLRELHQYLSNGQYDLHRKILKSVALGKRSEAEAQDLLSGVLKRTIKKDAEPLTVSNGRHSGTYSGEYFFAILEDPSKDAVTYCRLFVHHKIALLGGLERITLVNERDGGDLEAPSNSLAALFVNNQSRGFVRKTVFDAFDSYFVIDPTKLGKLRVRLSKTPPPTDAVEQGLDAVSRAFHHAAKPVEGFSDGVKAFCGILLEVAAGEREIVLIDEPEAFLHPILASRIGGAIAGLAIKERKQIYSATHSAHFLMGCIQAGAPVNIVRLTYGEGIPTARFLSAELLNDLMRNPLLRSTGVLNGLFQTSVIVTEADTDRAFYDEINERIKRKQNSGGIPDTLFLNAHGKDVLHQIIQPLRQMGVLTGAIVDIDVIKQGGQNWTRLLTSVGVPELMHGSLADLRNKVLNALTATGRNMKTDGGVTLLTGHENVAANQLFDILDEYGLFVVRNGELETWLPALGIARNKHGPLWLIEAFEKMGTNPTDPTYLQPANGDVWDFIAKVSKWVRNPSRKGME